MSINKLITIYEKWGKDNNIEPLLSADELLMENTCNRKQNLFLMEFIEAWEKAEEVESFLYRNMPHKCSAKNHVGLCDVCMELI
tara:strand:+ start:952 stop:1203 length:252 start_codon:yes stop_codon:yes gene_type:complete